MLEERAWRVGLAGAVLMFLCLSTFSALSVLPFRPGDESAHVNYALEVADGRLPAFDQRFEPRFPHMRTTPTWTAMHPPLYYSLIAVPLEAGATTEDPWFTVRSIRMVNVALGGLLVVLTAKLALLLVPHRRDVALMAAALIGLSTSLQQVSSFVYNDALALLLGTTTVLVAIRIVRDRWSWRTGILLAAAATAGAATRSSNLVAVALAIAAVAAHAWFLDDGARSQRARLVALRSGLIAAPVVAATGWFYLRNARMYGDPAGASYAANGDPTPVSRLVSPEFWLREYEWLWGHMTSATPVPPLPKSIAFAILLAIGAGAVRAGWPPRGPVRSAATFAWCTALSLVALTLMSLVAYARAGATPFERYYFPALPVLVVLGALALSHLPGWTTGVIGFAVMASAFAITLLGAPPLMKAVYPDLERGNWWTTLVRGLERGGSAAPALVLAAILAGAVTGLVACTYGHLTLARRSRTAAVRAEHTMRRPASRTVDVADHPAL